MAGRPATWPSKVEASELVRELYRAIAAVQAKPELFMECHVFDGAVLKHVPYVNHMNKAVPLHQVIGTFLGVNTGKKSCATHGCCNPLHFQGYNSLNILEGMQAPPETLSNPIQLDDYIEAVQYAIDKYETTDFDKLRSVLDPLDVPDEFLTLSIEKLKS